MVLSAKQASIMIKIDKIAVPSDFFQIHQMADNEGNSLYECLKCTRGQNKPLSCHDTWRQNLKKHSSKEETYFDLTCSSTVLTVQLITLFIMEITQPWVSPRILHHTSEHVFAEIQQNAEYRYGMSHPWVRLGSGLSWVGLGLGLQLELLIEFVAWCEKSVAKKVLVSVLAKVAILFSSSIGIGIGNTFHKYC